MSQEPVNTYSGVPGALYASRECQVRERGTYPEREWATSPKTELLKGESTWAIALDSKAIGGRDQVLIRSLYLEDCKHFWKWQGNSLWLGQCGIYASYDNDNLPALAHNYCSHRTSHKKWDHLIFTAPRNLVTQSRYRHIPKIGILHTAHRQLPHPDRSRKPIPFQLVFILEKASPKCGDLTRPYP